MDPKVWEQEYTADHRMKKSNWTQKFWNIYKELSNCQKEYTKSEINPMEPDFKVTHYLH